MLTQTTKPLSGTVQLGANQFRWEVWDGQPPTGEPGFEPGEGTGSATPLSWTHAQFVRLAWSIGEGGPVEQPSVVADRYLDS